MNEVIWKDVVGYEGRYQVSSNGDVYSLVTNKFMKLHENDDGYLGLQLRKDGKHKNWLVHVLVAQAFIPNPDNLSDVNHKDLDKKNNRVDNLEWVTHQENIRHAVKQGRFSKRFTEDDVREIRRRHEAGESGYKLAKEFGVNDYNIYLILNGHIWKEVK